MHARSKNGVNLYVSQHPEHHVNRSKRKPCARQTTCYCYCHCYHYYYYYYNYYYYDYEYFCSNHCDC